VSDIRPGQPGTSVISVRPKEHHVSIIPRKPLTALVNDVVQTTFTLENTSGMQLNNVQVTFQQCQLHDEDGATVETDQQFLSFVNTNGHKSHQYSYDLAESLQKGQSENLVACISVGHKSSLKMHIKVSAMLSDSPDRAFIDNHFFDIETRAPFSAVTRVYSINGELLNCFLEGQMAVIQVNVNVDCFSWVQLKSWTWTLDASITPLAETKEEADECLFNGDSFTPNMAVYLPILTNSRSDLNPGKLSLEWISPDSVETYTTSWSIDLGNIAVHRAPLVMTAKTRKQSLIVRSPITIDYGLANVSGYTLDLRLSVEHADGILFDGYKERPLRLLPGDTYDTSITMIALTAGYLPFPRLAVTCLDAQADQLLQNFSFKNLPQRIFVHPLSKSQH
jgi:hypothetical protein